MKFGPNDEVTIRLLVRSLVATVANWISLWLLRLVG